MSHMYSPIRRTGEPVQKVAITNARDIASPSPTPRAIGGTEKESEFRKNDIHPVQNFAWKHSYINIHQSIMVDILHQLLKGVTGVHLLVWLNGIISNSCPETRKRRGVKKTLEEALGRVRLDHQFRSISLFAHLKHFKDYRGMT